MQRPRHPTASAASPWFDIVVACVSACALAGCAALTDLERAQQRERDRTHAVPKAPAPLPQDPLDTIARLEDARSDGDGLLELFLARGEEPTRSRAAEALGRLSYPEHGAEVTRSLALALDDPSPRVRARAAFALGMRADPAASAAIKAHWSDPEPLVRARLVGAASRLPEQALWRDVLHALNDGAPEVRQEAALAPHRWPSDAHDASVVDSALIGFLAPRAADDAQSPAEKTALDDEVAWRLLFTLQQRKSERARAAFERGLSSSDARARIFSAQGLGKIASAPASEKLLCTALADEDWRVVCEAAVALGKASSAEARDGLAAYAEHPSAHVRRSVFEALGNVRSQREAFPPLFERARNDASPNVRAAAWIARARLFGDAIATDLDVLRREPDPLAPAACAQALAHLSSPVALPMLFDLSRHANVRVAGLAIESLGQHDTPEARGRLRELLASPDNGLRLAAVEALRKKPAPEDLAPLEACFSSARGDGATEVAFNVLENAALIGGDGAQVLLKLGLAHPDAFVRKKARAWIEKQYPESTLPKANGSNGKQASVPLAGRDFALARRRPRVVVHTSRGAMTFELFPEEAPVHVYNFLELAKQDHYDDLTFHRVVPDFVIQGGDYRGDGNGSVTWRGEPLRAEFTPRAYVRGSLGMPRNEDPDSGGSQFFVTHRETPHLDGRYTIFGELRDGFDVLDAIEVGDRITDVEILPAGASALPSPAGRNAR